MSTGQMWCESGQRRRLCRLEPRMYGWTVSLHATWTWTPPCGHRGHRYDQTSTDQSPALPATAFRLTCLCLYARTTVSGEAAHCLGTHKSSLQSCLPVLIDHLLQVWEEARASSEADLPGHAPSAESAAFSGGGLLMPCCPSPQPLWLPLLLPIAAAHCCCPCCLL